MKAADRARVQYIRTRLATDPRWARAALLRIYANQTASEQAAGMTSQHNGIGFTGFDGRFLSSLAERVQRSDRPLSVKQTAVLHKMMPKYAKQLLRMSDIESLDQIMRREQETIS